jgi:D-beta-D-heptose 7-phosphate kinase/D-beta-D-heptose 1-phosphate adenosyltransferase
MATQQQKKFNILLVGDSCTDRYQYGVVDRLSPEAPVPVFQPGYEMTRPGMAGNVYENLTALGCTVDFDTNTEKIIKTRYIDSRSHQHLMRVDQDCELAAWVRRRQHLSHYDAVVVSDYNRGFITYAAVKELRAEYTGPIFIDTKKTDLQQFSGCLVKINELEASRAVSRNDNLIVTRGDRGADYYYRSVETHYPAAAVEVADVCGAGDTFLAGLTFEYLRTQGNMARAIEFAIKASAVTVQHTGVYAPELKEIL